MKFVGPPVTRFICNFLNVIQLVQKLKGNTHTQTQHDLISLFFFLKEGK
jgi:hypothetical protein